MNRDKLNLYPDRLESKENLKFAHSVLVDWFCEMIKGIDPPFRIAITGDFGTGKSTIIYNGLKEIEKIANYKKAYVDVWKLDKQSVRKSTILSVAKQFEVDLKKENNLKKSLYGSITENSDSKETEGLTSDTPFYKQWHFLWVIILSLSSGTLFYFFISQLDDSNNITEKIKFIYSAAMALFFTTTNFISRKILRVKSIVERKPFVGAEEFEDAFQAILEDSNLKDKICIVIFDNIDRTQGSRTEEILTGISAFFDHSSHNKNRNLIIIVPFSTENTQFDVKTIQKFFDVVIPIPNIMPEDLMEFAENKIKRIGWTEQEAEDIAQLIDQSPLKTPREILHFINELNVQISLAQKLENERHTEGNRDYETYLSMGSITNSKIFFAKLKLCQKIEPSFLKNSLNEYLSPQEAMDFKKYRESNEDIYSFLRATDGIPTEYPESLEPFSYFKGADVELSIPGGPKIIKSLVNRKVEDVQEFIKKDSNTDNLEKLFIQAFKKNKNNPQRIKNSIHTVLSACEKININSKEFRKKISEAIKIVPDIIKDISIENLKKITIYSGESIENEEVWKIADERYISLMNKLKERPELSETYKSWRMGYLKEIMIQPCGVTRANLKSNDLLSEDFYVKNFLNL